MINDLNVLYVEDEAEERKLFYNLLLKLFQKDKIKIANDGLDGLNVFKEDYLQKDKSKKIDIIITDICMPKMDGFEMIKAIFDINPNVKVIILSAFTDFDNIKKAAKFGLVNNYLQKPLYLKELLPVIERLAKEIDEEKIFLQEEKLYQDYKYAVDSSQIISKTDTKGIITYVNDLFCKVSGFTRDELIGQNHNIVRDSDMRDDIFKELWLTIKSGNIWQGIIKNKTKSGGSYIVKTMILPLYDKNNKINEYIAIRTDITEYVNKRDKEADIAEDKTLMLFTHELKTPLNAIISYSSYINRNINKQLTPKKIEKISQLIRNIEANGSSLLSTITSMLDISKFKHNALEINKERINFSKLITDKVELYGALSNKNITLNIGNNIEIFSDSNSVDHIFENLLSNAIKYSNNNISISIESNENYVSLIVEDDGLGIDYKNVEKIFKLFGQQSDGRDDKEKTGTGIGLYLVSILVNLNKFSIDITKSKDLNGACFRVSNIPKCK